MNLTLTYVIRFNITWGSLFFIDREATRFAVSNCIHYWQMVQINAIVKSLKYYSIPNCTLPTTTDYTRQN